jgi:adenine nucleotide transporter 17
VGALSTLEGILAGLIAGSVTSILTNPIWTIQTYQSTRAVAVPSSEGDGKPVRKIKPGLLESAHEILAKDGYKGFFRGVGPALVLVCNPVIQVC